MRKTIPLLLMTALVVASCGRVADSRFNPLNWFGRAESRAVNAGEANPLLPRRALTLRPEELDNRTPVAQITGLNVERLPGGAIVRVTAVSARQGAHNVGLKPVLDETVPADAIRFLLVADQPGYPVGSEPTRRINAGVKLTDQDMAGIRRIEVQGAQNILTVRR
ncbi:MAG: hypothetical protein ACPH5G_15375 [Pseudooceanicola atlanticus]